MTDSGFFLLSFHVPSTIGSALVLFSGPYWERAYGDKRELCGTYAMSLPFARSSFRMPGTKDTLVKQEAAGGHALIPLVLSAAS